MTEPLQIIVAENWEYMKVVSVSLDDEPTGVATTAILSLCALPKWIRPNPDCGLTTAQIAEKDIPDGVKYEIIDADKFEEYRDIGIGSTALLMVGAITNFDFDTNSVMSKLYASLAKRGLPSGKKTVVHYRYDCEKRIIKNAIKSISIL